VILALRREVVDEGVGSVVRHRLQHVVQGWGEQGRVHRQGHLLLGEFGLDAAAEEVVIAVEEPVEVLQQILFVFDAVRHAAPHPAQITPRVNSHDGVAYPGDHVGHASQGLLTFANNSAQLVEKLRGRPTWQPCIYRGSTSTTENSTT
jgi:hypothetical protein